MRQVLKDPEWRDADVHDALIPQYQGDELGMEDVEVPPERVVDPDGRDPERSPRPWTGAPRRGFCPDGVEPWLPFGDPAVNVEAQEADPRSMLALHRRLLALRRESDALAEGAYATFAAGPAVLAYPRSGMRPCPPRCDSLRSSTFSQLRNL